MAINIGQLLRKYGPVAAPIASGILNRRAVGSQLQNLTGGVNAATGTLQGAQSAQQALYGPYSAVAGPALQQLVQGTQPGGNLAAPFQFDMAKFWDDPNIKRRTEEGNKFLARRQASTGSLRSGAAIQDARNYNDQQIANEFNTEYSRQQGTFRADQDQALTALLAQIGVGQFGASNQGDSLQRTATAISGLQTDLASAQAAGDVAKVNTITDTINGIIGAVDKIGLKDQLGKILGGAAPAAGGIGAALGGIGTATLAAPGTAALGAQMSSLAALAGGLPSAASVAAPAGTAAAGAGGSAGLGSTLAGLATNPITIGAAAALGVGVLWAKSQAHHEAKDWTSNFQDPFDKQMAAINESAQYPPQVKSELQKIAVTDYLAAAMEFAKKKGSDGTKVIGQAMREFRRWYPQFANQAVA